MIYHTDMTRESVLRASSILDMLAIGWRPADAELATARHIDHWAIRPGAADGPYQIIGTSCLLPARPSIIVASVIAIDPSAGWARIWDEWVVIDEMLVGAQAFDANELQRAGANWLLAQLSRLLPVH